MALSSEGKLKNFADEVKSDAKQICDQIRQQTKTELHEKTKEGKEKILAGSREYILQETEKMKREKSLEISKANIKARQEYFKYGGELSSKIFEAVRKKLEIFKKSGAYGDYLLQCCKNVMEKNKTDLAVFYMREDGEIMTKKVKAELEKSFGPDSAEFMEDETIKTGGLRFFDRAKNILINDVFDEKTERAKELLNSIISPHFTSINN